MKKIFIIALTVVLVFSFATTAFADTWQDYAEWSSSVCLYGFTTSQSVQKPSGESWACIIVDLDSLSFSTTPNYNYCWATPRTTSGLNMGVKTAVHMTGEPFIDIFYSKKFSYDDIKLRIDNANSGNNMASTGWWEGYIE